MLPFGAPRPSEQLAVVDEPSAQGSSSAQRALRGRNSGERRAVRPTAIVFIEPLEFLRGFRIEPRRQATPGVRLAQAVRALRARGLGRLSAVAHRHATGSALKWRQPGSGEARVLPYFELETRSNQLARALHAHGVGPRSRVVVALGCRPELVLTLSALLKLGAEAVVVEAGADPEQLAELAPSHALLGPEWLSALGSLLQWLPRERVLGISDPARAGSETALAGLIHLDEQAARQPGTSLRAGVERERTACLCVVPQALPDGNGWAPPWYLTTERWCEIGERFSAEWQLTSEDTVYVAAGDVAALVCGWAAALNAGASVAFRRAEAAEPVTEDLWRFEASAFLYSAR